MTDSRLFRYFALFVLAPATPWLAFPGSAAGQFSTRPDRPDFVAPAGVLGDHTLDRGRVELSYRFINQDYEGLREQASLFDVEDVFELFEFAPAVFSRASHRLGVGYGASDALTLGITVPIVLTDMGFLTPTGDAFFQGGTELGDVEVAALYDVFREGPYRAHLNLGFTLPTGSTTASDVGPLGTTVLPYPLQAGSGSFAISPGATLLVMNEHGAVGAQLVGTLRLNDADPGYRLGNRVQFSAWIAPRINDFFSVSARMVFENWDSVSGRDPAVNPDLSPVHVAAFQGGTRVDIPFGLNFYMAEGPLQGHRVSLEMILPAHQDYDGIQPDGNYGLVVIWQKAF